jgi:hypothetical protein
MTSEAPIFVHRRAAMISPQRHRDRIAAFGRHQNHVGRKKRKEAKEKRKEAGQVHKGRSVFASSFVFCGSILSSSFGVSVVSVRVKQSQFRAAWRAGPGAGCTNKPNLEGPSAGTVKPVVQTKPIGRQSRWPGARNKANLARSE